LRELDKNMVTALRISSTIDKSEQLHDKIELEKVILSKYKGKF
jgi:hypothetical protein